MILVSTITCPMDMLRVASLADNADVIVSAFLTGLTSVL